MTFRHDFVPTPFGDALAVFSDDGIVSFDLSESADPSVPWLLEGISRRLGEVPDEAPGAGDELAHLLDDYFEGAPIRFDEHVRFDWRLIDGFPRAALQAVVTGSGVGGPVALLVVWTVVGLALTTAAVARRRVVPAGRLARWVRAA